jgi:hypothetical protein
MRGIAAGDRIALQEVIKEACLRGQLAAHRGARQAATSISLLTAALAPKQPLRLWAFATCYLRRKKGFSDFSRQMQVERREKTSLVPPAKTLHPIMSVTNIFLKSIRFCSCSVRFKLRPALHQSQAYGHRVRKQTAGRS